jgi:hypothetical protein
VCLLWKISSGGDIANQEAIEENSKRGHKTKEDVKEHKRKGFSRYLQEGIKKGQEKNKEILEIGKGKKRKERKRINEFE